MNEGIEGGIEQLLCKGFDEKQTTNQRRKGVKEYISMRTRTEM